jgi:hypothetical protein
MALKQTTNSTKHPKNENYNELLDLQPSDHVDGAPPLPLLPESA